MPELSRFEGMVVKEEEAYAAWNKAVRGEHFDKIKPLNKRGRLNVYIKWNCIRK